jgi:hypothetical protein
MKDTNDGIDLWSCEGELRHLIVSRRGLLQDKAWMYLGASASIRLLSVTLAIKRQQGRG